MKSYDFQPWKIRIDKDKSAHYYMENDLSEDKVINDNFFKFLDAPTSHFLLEFGLNPDKIKVTIMPAIPEADEDGIFSKDCYIAGFVFCGEFDAIPADQWDFYFGYIGDNAPIFEIDENTPQKVPVDEVLNLYQPDDKMGLYRFSPGAAYDDTLEVWNSGYIYCKGIFRIS